MRFLAVAGVEPRTRLAALLDGAEVDWAGDATEACERLGQRDFDVVLLHHEIGEEAILDLLCEVRRRPPERVAGVLVVARAIGHRALVEIVRTGAYDVLLEESLAAGELIHAARNAAYYVRSGAALARRRSEKAAAPLRAVVER